MKSPTSTFNEQRKGLLSFLQMTLTEIENHHNTLERKMQYNLSFMSSIAALELVIHLHLMSIGTLPKGMVLASIAFAIVYLAVATICLVAIWPQSRASLPFEPTPEKVREWWGFDIIKYRDAVITRYVTIWKENQELLDDKVKQTERTYILVAIALVVVLIQAALYRHHGLVMLATAATGQ